MRTRNVGVAAWGFALVLAVVAAPAVSVPITFVHEGRGSGTLNGVPFAASDFVITSVTDTLNRQSFSGGFFIDHLTSSIAINGVATVSVVTPTRTFNSQAGNLVGYSRASINGLDLFNGPSAPDFAAWDMTTSIGPISGTGGLLQWSSTPQIVTSSGILIFDSASSPAVFTAIIPEPSALALSALAIAPAALRRRRR